MRAIVAYLAVGGVLALLTDRRFAGPSSRSRIGSALLCIVAWPLFAPLTWLPMLAMPEPAAGPVAQRVEQVLLEARRIVAGSVLDDLLPQALMARLLAGLNQVDRRHAELCALLQRPEFSDGTRAGKPDGIEQLRAMHARDEEALRQLGVLADTLRARLLVARYTSGHADGSPRSVANGPELRELALELTTRVDSLGALFELDSMKTPVDTPRAR